jgi:hypothetical protein
MMPPARKIVAASTDGAAGGGAADQAEPGEQEGDDHGREHLEEALDPEVDHPPAPVLGDREVGVPAGAERGEVEAADRDGRDQEQHQDQRPLGVLAADRRPQRARDQHDPQQQADQQRDLEEAAEVDVLVAAVPEPPHAVVAELPLIASSCRAIEPSTTTTRATEQDVDAERWPAARCRRPARSQARGEPRGRDPEDAELDVPRAGDRVRQDLRQRDAVEARRPRRRSGRR